VYGAIRGYSMTSKNRERFITLAEKRVTKVIKGIRLVGNLSNKTNYSYTDEHVKKIISTLEAEIRKLRQRFETQSGSDNITFKL
jgi:hypothetical protein